ncbi:ribulose-phosphate 3-epimerase [Lactobacillus sp. CC-MHH1034]|uniref:ribulose-phosphate 3-epimerase n=1 Tax=Agrilactobacillus fermenti TaxID=2586909 RepID=UPI001E4E07FE|nr:ribulose-phosphate 3-epimerase [Agrilactobacillus fermenti]MCD2256225.1 ribulose-phosphate 3-epimerase [Agrilactobacillus fermenti]
MQLAPSILSADFINLQRDVSALEAGGADLLHVDVMDGHFVPNLAFGPQVVQALRPITKLPLDVHLMMSHPEAYIDMFAAAGADTIMVHFESTPHIYHALQLIAQRHVKPGVVINPGTPVDALKSVLPLVGQVLIMTVNPGFGGQAFLPSTLEKVAHLDQIRQTDATLTFDIEVDGGINDQTIQQAAKAGADIFVAGSYIFGGHSVAEQITKLKGLIK